MKILIVEDSESMRRVLVSVLVGQGHRVVAELPDGEGLLEAVRASAPDIVCLDYNLPGRDGISLLGDLNAAYPEVDVVMITSSEDESIERSAADAGAAGFIRKPFGQGRIIAELEQIRATRERSRSGAALEVAEQAGAASCSKGPGGAKPDPSTVVIADDNGSIRMLLSGLLTDIGFKVVQLASNGAEAVTAVEARRPGVVCLDVDMPVMSGLEALPAIRERSPDSVVVMVTATATREFVEKAVALGARGYIVKPLRPAYVESFMKKLLP